MAVTPRDCVNEDTNELARVQIERVENQIDERLLKDFNGQNEVTIFLAPEHYDSTATIIAHKYANSGWGVNWVRLEDKRWRFTFKTSEKIEPGRKSEKKKEGVIDLKKEEKPERNLDLDS